MSTKQKTPSPVDLEETAELPGLPAMVANAAAAAPAANAPDRLSATDEWRVPKLDPGTEPSTPAASHTAKPGALRSAMAETSEDRGRLESNLHNLTSNLRELEQLLNDKSEQLSVYEREVGQRDRRIAQLESQSGAFEGERAALQGEREELRNQLDAVRAEISAAHIQADARDLRIAKLETQSAALTQERNALVGERDALREQLNNVRAQVSAAQLQATARDQRLASLESQVMALTQERTTLAGERDALSGQLESARAAASSASGRAASLDEARGVLQSQSAEQIRQLHRLESDLERSRALTERLQETLQSLEGRRHLFESMLLEADSSIGEREQRIAALERDLAERGKHSGAREEELLVSLRTEQERGRELDLTLAAVKDERDAQQRRFEASNKSAEERAAALEAQLQTQREVARDLDERVRQGAAREQDLHMALRNELERAAAHERARTALGVELDAHKQRLVAMTQTTQGQVAALETQLRTQAQSVEELTKRLDHGGVREEELRVELRAERGRSQGAAADAQQRIEALEAEVRAQGETIIELRARVSTVRDSLEQRNALIRRLEAETASSAAVLGNIQENLQHMGQGEPKRMLVRTEGETGIVQLLTRKTTIGRTPDNDLRIDADFISRHHAVVLFSGSNTVIEDLNSTNGTFVNGERVSRCMLTEGDLVTIGKTEFRFIAKPSTERAD